MTPASSAPTRLFQGRWRAPPISLPSVPTRPHHASDIPQHFEPVMLRRKPTAITLTSEDVAAFEDSRIAKVQGAAENVRTSKDTQAGDPDPNDELRPLPGDKVRAMRAGQSRDERIGVSR